MNKDTIRAEQSMRVLMAEPHNMTAAEIIEATVHNITPLDQPEFIARVREIEKELTA